MTWKGKTWGKYERQGDEWMSRGKDEWRRWLERRGLGNNRKRNVKGKEETVGDEDSRIGDKEMMRGRETMGRVFGCCYIS